MRFRLPCATAANQGGGGRSPIASRSAIPRASETKARTSAAQMAVHQNSSIVSRSVSASVMLRRTALTIKATSPNVTTMSGEVRIRKIVPTTAFTTPKSDAGSSGGMGARPGRADRDRGRVSAPARGEGRGVVSDDHRAMLESIAFGDDEWVTPADRLRAIGVLRELDRDEQTARFTRQASEPYAERDPDRIERILELALLHVGSPIIEARAEERARELLAERRFTAIPGGLENRNHAAR